MGYCQSDWQRCSWKGLRAHWERAGQHEGREFNCTHIRHCTRANLNLLNLVDKDRVPYNICRNLEWQVCAAQGLLPGQGAPNIKFSYAPKDMDVNGLEHSLGRCAGWHPGEPPGKSGGLFGFTNDDIYFMEICLFNQICENKQELFELVVGQEFVCDFSPTRFAELETIIRTPALPEPQGTLQCTMDGGKHLDHLIPPGALRESITCEICEALHAQTPGECSDIRDCDVCSFCQP